MATTSLTSIPSLQYTTLSLTKYMAPFPVKPLYGAVTGKISSGFVPVSRKKGSSRSNSTEASQPNNVKLFAYVSTQTIDTKCLWDIPGLEEKGEISAALMQSCSSRLHQMLSTSLK